MAGPLTGIRILDLSQVVAGPLATMMLAEQGADVFKIEAPGGETIRLGNPESMVGLFANNNRGKRCVSVDLGKEGASALLLDMAKTCDVFVENFRPGVAGRLGVGLT